MAAPHLMDVVRMMEPRKASLQALRALMEAEGRACEEVTDPPGTRYGMHKHPFDDFVVIVSGRMKLGTETHTWLQKAADLFGFGTDAIRWIRTDAAKVCMGVFC